MLGTILGNGKDVVAFILLFGFTIFIHELGHFVAAIKLGMVVETFSIGFGPAIWKRKIRGVMYKIGWIPFGGYVSLPQLDPSGMATIQGSEEKKEGDDAEKEPEAEKPREYPVVAAWKKIIVSISGCIGNLVLAFILAWVVYLGPDVSMKNVSTQVGFVAENSAAYERGLRPGDEIVAVNGKPVKTWYEYSIECHLGGGRDKEVLLSVISEGSEKSISIPVQTNRMEISGIEGVEKVSACRIVDVVPGSRAAEGGMKAKDLVKTVDGQQVFGAEQFVDIVRANSEKKLNILVERDGQPLMLEVTPKFEEKLGYPVIGVHPADIAEVVPWMQERKPLAQLKADAQGIARILKALVTPREAKQAYEGLGGPIFIFFALWTAIKISFFNAIGFVRFLNLNLAILNLLPIPVLDGGHVVFSLYEGIARRKANPKVINVLINFFAMLLIGFMLFITYRDFIRLKIMKWDKSSDDTVAVTNAPAAVAVQVSTNSAGPAAELPSDEDK